MGAAAFDLRLVQPFVVLVEERLHFRSAAERLGIGQPALSRQMARLQHELGVTLLVREGRHSLLTPAGARFLAHARAILHRGADLQLDLQADTEALRLHLGNAAHRRIDEIVSGFIAAHPSMVLDIQEGTSVGAVVALQRHDADIIFGLRSGCPEGMRFSLLERAPLGLLMGADHRLAHMSQISWSDLNDEKVIFGPDPTSHMNVLVRSCLAEAEITVREVIGVVLGKLHYLAPMIARGDASLITTRALFDPPPDGVAWSPLVPDRHAEFGIMWDAHLARQAARDFVDFVASSAPPVPSPAAPRTAASSAPPRAVADAEPQLVHIVEPYPTGDVPGSFAMTGWQEAT